MRARPWHLALGATIVLALRHAALLARTSSSTPPAPPPAPLRTPDLFFIGASKCGTSTLAAVLTLHPEIVSVTARNRSEESGEAHLLDKLSSPAAVRAKLAALQQRILVTGSRNATVTMDYTPHYLFDARIPFRLCASFADACRTGSAARFVVLLREPVARAYSSWAFKRDGRGERRALEPALMEGIAKAGRIEACLRAYREKCTGTDPDACTRRAAEGCRKKFEGVRAYFAHVEKGLYAAQLKTWLAYIPRASLLVLRLEDMAKDPLRTYRAVLAHVGLPEPDDVTLTSAALALTRPRNVGTGGAHTGRTLLPLSDEWKKKLAKFYCPRNRELNELLGQELYSTAACDPR